MSADLLRRVAKEMRERTEVASHRGEADVRAHGTRSRYMAGCKCAECREANRVGCAASRQGRMAATAANGGVAPIDPHGSRNTYINWGCRCVPCTEANRLATARWRAS